MLKRILKKITDNPLKDTLSGMTVSLAMIPEVVAFAFVAAIDPLVALSGAFIVGLISAIFGGRPGLISGAAGAVAVIFVHLIQQGNERGLLFDVPVENMGYYYLLGAVILMGLFQVLAGVFKIGKFVRLIPHPVMMGFVNGLAIVIFLAQVKMFSHQKLVDLGNGLSEYITVPMVGAELWLMIGLVILTMAVVHFLPKLTKKIPAALVAIVLTTLVVIIAKLDVSTVGSYIVEGGGTGLSGSLPVFNMDLWRNIPFTTETLIFILPYAFLAASVGLIESLMTMNLVDEMTNTRGKGNQECIAQGLGNTVSGLFGGTGGCGMIGQTVVNLSAGGRGKLSGIVMSLTLLVFILFADSYIEQVPTAALIGVMFMMVIDTFAWSSFRILKKIPFSDALVLIVVSAVTVFVDLAVAVFVGVIISALVFAWESAQHIRAESEIKGNVTTYKIFGPLFFGSVSGFNELFNVEDDAPTVVIDFMESRVSDHSALEAILVLIKKYQEAGKTIRIQHLSDNCRVLMTKKSEIFKDIVIDGEDDPHYQVMDSFQN